MQYIGAASLEELVAKSRETVRKPSCESQQDRQQAARGGHDGSAPATGQHGIQARASGAEQQYPASATLRGNGAASAPVQQVRGPDGHAAAAAAALAGSEPLQQCQPYALQQGDAARAGSGAAHCTVYAAELGDKGCCGGMPGQNGFLEPFALQDSVPDSASE